MANQDAVKILKEELDVVMKDFPKEISIDFDGKNNLTMTLLLEATGIINNQSGQVTNMQDNNACFEGWVLAIRAANENLNIKLCVSGLDGRLQVQVEQNLSSNYISGIHLIKKSVEQFIRSVVA